MMSMAVDDGRIRRSSCRIKGADLREQSDELRRLDRVALLALAASARDPEYFEQLKSMMPPTRRSR
jgi:hypothetical protein